MLRYLFLFILIIHGLIHLMGFFKAYQLAEIEQLTKTISRPAGSIWLLTMVLFMVATVLFLVNDRFWPIISIIAILLSQILILMSWQDAKFGTIANVIILLVVVFAIGQMSFERSYQKDAKEGINRIDLQKKEILTEADLADLPVPVQQYIRLSEAVGQPKVKNFRIKFEGRMRDRTKGWFSFTAEQHTFLDQPERLFFMKAKMKGLPVAGYHRYKDGEAKMTIKLLSLFPVVNLKGPEMLKAETVTVFNDMCLMAPASLIDDRISWQSIDRTTAKATFTVEDISISATLYFNEKGELVNFISDDRYSVDEMEQYRFSTPVSNYEYINGHYLMHYGEAVWHYPEGEFTYGQFDLKYLEYNVEND